MSLADVIRHAIMQHSQRAAAEGRAYEAHFLALVEDLIMTTVNDIQGKLSSLDQKFAQLEADVGALVKIAGGTASGGGTTSGLSLTQDQADAIGSKLDDLSTRADALNTSVLAGTPSSVPPTVPPTTSAPTTGTTAPGTSSGTSSTLPSGSQDSSGAGATTASPPSSTPTTSPPPSTAAAPSTGTAPPPSGT